MPAISLHRSTSEAYSAGIRDMGIRGGDMRFVCQLTVFLGSLVGAVALSGCVQDSSPKDARMDAAVVIPQCADGIDNDDDGRVDLDDPGCLDEEDREK